MAEINNQAVPQGLRIPLGLLQDSSAQRTRQGERKKRKDRNHRTKVQVKKKDKSLVKLHSINRDKTGSLEAPFLKTKHTHAKNKKQNTNTNKIMKTTQTHKNPKSRKENYVQGLRRAHTRERL